MAKPIKIMCVHGLGDHRSGAWREEWSSAVRLALGEGSEVAPEFHFASYDHIFEDTKISFGETMRALWKLARSGIGRFGRRDRGIVSDVSDKVRWTAGYVVAWVEDEKFQQRTRKFVLDAVRQFKPDVILAHSLGSLITYNAFSHDDAGEEEIAKLLKKAHYVTFGSQIGNPFVIGNLTFGRVLELPVRHWHHLYNEHDDVFTAPLNVRDVANFNQLLTPFDLAGRGDHTAGSYIAHQVTSGSFWQPLVVASSSARAFGARDPWKRTKGDRRPPMRKALLVGINDYPHPEDRLEGCVNDVFAMSAVLQECGFRPDDIRTCLNERATTAAILERLAWLVDEAQGGDQLVFYYSGHGARVPEYGEYLEPDRMTETLVPWDFDFTPETSVSDEQIYALYSQLPYDLDMMLIFDCCHSGSMHRQGGARARGITPPDDIRHRQLRWDAETEMWVERKFESINDEFRSRLYEQPAFFGANGATVRLGRSSMLRRESTRRFKAAERKADGPVGPYLPLIIEACAEEELSYEYRHGVTSYGAFTYCLATILRREKSITFESLVTKVREQLAKIGYQQTPQILGPSSKVTAQVPLETGQAKPVQETRGVPGILTPRTSG